MSTENIVINVEFNKSHSRETLDSEIQVVPAEISWEDLEMMLRVCAECEEIRVNYLDEDNEKIAINSQEELNESFKVARQFGGTLRVCVESCSTDADSKEPHARCENTVLTREQQLNDTLTIQSTEQVALSPAATQIGSSTDMPSAAGAYQTDTAALSLNMAVMHKLVHEKMNNLSADKTGGSIASNSSSSDNSFYIVPIPDCFNTDLPPSKVASTSLIVQKPLKSTASQATAWDPQRSHEATAVEPPGSHEATADESLGSHEATAVEPPGSHEATAYESLGSHKGTAVEPPGSDEGVDMAKSALEDGVSSRAHSSAASGFLQSAVAIASHAAFSAFSTAKDVYYTLQAKNSYVPVESEWTPPQSTWTPPQSSWIPATSSWQPGSWSERAEQWSGVAKDPVSQLIEMGFGNRQLNEQLLNKYNGDMEQAVNELIADSDADWHAHRH